MSTMLLVGVAAFASTMLGGLFALRLRDRLHLILGFGAGAVIAVAFFDLIPEAIEMGHGFEVHTIVSLVAVGFLVYLLLDRVLVLHNHADAEHHAPSRGQMRAGSFSVHSFLDGVGVGLASQLSLEAGIVVGIAVLAHGFSDGINTVNAIIRHGGERMRALRWLAINGTAPMLGIVSTFFFSVSEGTLAILLALFSGFFLYIGASELVPESHHAHPAFWTTAMTIFGAALLFVVIRLAGH